MLVSSLCTTSPLAACRISSARIGRVRVARSSTISHWVEAGSGICRSRLQPFEAVERHPAAVLQERDHRAGGRIVLLGADARRRIGRKELAAQMAAEFFELVDRRGDRRLADEPHEDAGLALPGTACRSVQSGHRSPWCRCAWGTATCAAPPVRVGGVPAMAAAAGRGRDSVGSSAAVPPARPSRRRRGPARRGSSPSPSPRAGAGGRRAWCPAGRGAAPRSPGCRWRLSASRARPR